MKKFNLIVCLFIVNLLYACGGGSGSSAKVIPPSRPEANAGEDQSVDENATVLLTGSGSITDGSIVSYRWTQTAGTSVVVSDNSSASASFIAPNINSAETLVLLLTVTDNNGVTDSDEISIIINDVPALPLPEANAGEDQSVDENTTVLLTGSGSITDGSIVSYLWTQTAGTSVVVSDNTSASTSFIAPDISANESLIFVLTVTDNNGVTDSDEIHIIIKNVPPSSPPYDMAAETYSFEIIYSQSILSGGNDQTGPTGAQVLLENEIFTQYGDFYYILTIAPTGRPQLVKIDKADTSIITMAYLDAADYLPLDDSHHDFTMAIDKDGYIHIVGDMHNYPDKATEHMPARYQTGSSIMYWRSSVAQDITSMTYLGHSSSNQQPQGLNFTYPHFFQDNHGELYFSSRNHVNGASTEFPSNKGASFTKYDAAAGTWSLIGEFSENTAAKGKLVLWEDNDSMASPYLGYNKIHPIMAFDMNNRMHYSATILNDSTIHYGQVALDNGSRDKIFHWSTDLLYMTSSNQGVDFYKNADELDLIQLPGRVEAGPNQAEIAYHSPGSDTIINVDNFIATDYKNNPIISILKLRLSNDPVKPFGTYIHYDGTNWIEYSSLGSQDRYVRNLMSDNQGAITNIVKGNKYLYRFWSPADEPVKLTLPVVLNGADRKTLKETGNLLAYGWSNGVLTFLKITVNKPAH